MTVKVSRAVADRASINNTVVAAIDVHGPEVAPDLDAILFPYGGPGGIHMGLILTAFGNALRESSARLQAADQSHAAELADDDGYRKNRDGAVGALRAVFISLRAALTNNYGPEVAAAYGVASALPDDTQTLIHSAGAVEKLLRERPLVEPPIMKGLAVDPLLVADDLKAAADAAQKALGDVEREKREAQATLDKKNTELDTWARRYPPIAEIVSQLFTLAGRPALADRVKPTTRRRAGLPEEGDLPPDATPPAAEGAPQTP